MGGPPKKAAKRGGGEVSYRLLEFLRGLAETRGRAVYAPKSEDEPGLRSFQSEVDEIEDLAGQGLLRIVGKPHQESITGHRYVDRIQLEVTGKGVNWINSLQPRTDMSQDIHLTRLAKLYKAVAGSRSNLILLSDVLKDEGLSAREVWDEADYMEGKGWIKIEVDEAPLVRLTHAGIKAAESFLPRETARETAAPPAPSTARPSGKSQLRVFLCHSSGDKPAVRDLYDRLSSAADYIAPWLDEEDLLPGQQWEEEIPKAVRESDVVIVCLSRDSINRKGYVQKEIKYALDAADEQPEGTIFLIPVRLEDCELPDRLKHLHSVNLYDSKGFERLLRALKARAEKLGVIEAPERVAEIAKSVPNITQLIGRTPAEVERIAGEAQARTEITNDPSQMPGEFREYEVYNSRLGLTVYGMMVRYHQGRAVHITVDLPDQFESAEEALLAVGVDVRGTIPRVIAPMATRWIGKFNGVDFKDVAAMKTDQDLHAFSTVQITLIE